MKLVPVHKIQASAFIWPGTDVDQCTQSAVIVHGVVAVVAAKIELGSDLAIAPDELVGVVATLEIGSASALVGIAAN